MFAKQFHLTKTFCTCSQNFLNKSANVQKTNVQMCKCAKNRRAQNAQICSANIFSNAEMHKSANAQFCQMQNSQMRNFFSVCRIFLCNFSKNDFRVKFFLIINS